MSVYPYTWGEEEQRSDWTKTRYLGACLNSVFFFTDYKIQEEEFISRKKEELMIPIDTSSQTKVKLKIKAKYKIKW